MQEVPKSNQDKLNELKNQVGQAFFDYGRLSYEIEVSQKAIENIKVNLNNWSVESKKLQEAVDKEKKQEAMEVKLTPTEETAAQ